MAEALADAEPSMAVFVAANQAPRPRLPRCPAASRARAQSRRRSARVTIIAERRSASTVAAKDARRQGGREARKQGDKEARRQGGKEARRQGLW